MTTETQSEDAVPAPSLFIGQDPIGLWVVRDARGLYGGLFVNRKEACRFAMFESRGAPRTVMMMPYGLELDPSFDAAELGRSQAKRVA